MNYPMAGEARCPAGHFLFLGLFVEGSIRVPCCRRFFSLIEANGGLVSITHLPRADRRGHTDSASNAATGFAPETASKTEHP